MELYWLQDFLSLVRNGNFSRAAAERHVTQSAFSRRIQALEDWAGAPLFDRATHPIELTEVGQKLLPIAVTSVGPLLDFRLATRSHATDAAPTISFIMPTALSSGVFPPLLGRLKREIGPMIGRCAVRRIDEIASHCASGEADLALNYRHPALPRPLQFDELDAIEVGDDPLIPVCAPQHRDHPDFCLPLAPQATLNYLPYGRNSYIGQAVDAEIAQRVSRVRQQKLFDDPLIFVLKELAQQGIGVAWLPRCAIQRNLADGTLIRAGGPEWDIPLTVELLRRRKKLSDTAEAIWSLLSLGAAPLDRRPVKHLRAVEK